MLPWLRRLPMALAALWLITGPATAHIRSESHAVWEINRDDVSVVLTFANIEAARLTEDGSQPDDETVKTYLASRLYPIADGVPCPLVPPITTLAATQGFRKYDLTFRCPAARNLRIRSSIFFDRIASHTNFAQIQNVATGEFVEQLITNDRQIVDVTADGGSELQSASFFEFIRMGIMHILTGVDHMSFLLGLVLISKRLRDLIFVVTGFTIGHSLTLALAVTGVIRPHAEYIDALVALTIALIGAECIAVSIGRPKIVAFGLFGWLLIMALGNWVGLGGLPALLLLGAGLFSANYLMISGRLQDAGRVRLVITLIFGLVHGFGFAADLLELQLPTKRLAELLVGFNVGVEIGQLTLVLAVTLLAVVLSRVRLAVPRPILTDISGAFLVGLGVYWFVLRSYG